MCASLVLNGCNSAPGGIDAHTFLNMWLTRPSRDESPLANIGGATTEPHNQDEPADELVDAPLGERFKRLQIDDPGAVDAEGERGLLLHPDLDVYRTSLQTEFQNAFEKISPGACHLVLQKPTKSNQNGLLVDSENQEAAYTQGGETNASGHVQDETVQQDGTDADSAESTDRDENEDQTQTEDAYTSVWSVRPGLLCEGGRSVFSEKDKQEAQRIVEKALEMRPADLDCLLMMEGRCTEMCTWDILESVYRAAVRCPASDPHGCAYALTRIALLEQDQKEKLHLVRRAHQLSPAQRHVVRSLADMEGEIGNSTAAASMHLTLILQEPQRIESLRFLANWSEAYHQMEEALEYYQRVSELLPNDPFVGMGWAKVLYKHNKAYEYAEALFRAMLEQNPSSLDVRSSYAEMLCARSANLSAAYDMWQSVLDLDPMNSRALVGQGTLINDHYHNFSRASELFEQVLSANPAHEDAVLKYGNVLRERGAAKGKGKEGKSEFAMAEKIYRNALDVAPDSAPILCDLAFLMWHTKNDTAQARDLFSQAVTARPNSADVYCSYAIFVTEKEGMCELAAALYKMALTRNPRHQTALFNFALYHQDVTHNERAAELCYQEVLKVSPQEIHTLVNMATLLDDYNHNPEEVCAVYERALEIDPTNTIISCNYATILYERMGRSEEAREIFKGILSLDPANTVALCKYGTLLEDVDCDHHRAETVYMTALDIDPQCVNALCNLGMLNQEVRQNHQRATQMYIRALEVDPDHATTMCNYGTLLYDVMHDNERAEVLYKRALEADPGHTTTLCNYAGMKRDMGDLDTAEALYRRAVANDPFNSMNWCLLGNLLSEGKKDYRAAAPAYEKALQFDPNSVTTLLNFGHLLALEGHKFEKAEALLTRAQALVPDNSDAQQGLEFVKSISALFKARETLTDMIVPRGMESTSKSDKGNAAVRLDKQRKGLGGGGNSIPMEEMSSFQLREAVAEKMARELLEEEDKEKAEVAASKAKPKGTRKKKRK